LQDILVWPEFQGQGIGKKLLNHCLKRFAHVRMKVLLTDDREQQLRFYEAMGYTNTKQIHQFELNTFVKFTDQET
jgi:ribosomal protein S18 acetylase RimI-like enzyme